MSFILPDGPSVRGVDAARFDIGSMRQTRFKAPQEWAAAFYDCSSRVVAPQFALDQVQKEHFVALMRGYEAFCGIEVVTYCLVDDHFDLLIKVPRRPADALLPTDEELVDRVRMGDGCYDAATLSEVLGRLRKDGLNQAAQEIQAVLVSGGRLGLCESLRCQVRYFSAGLVIGSRAFVEELFEANRWRFGPRRKTGARPLEGIDAGDLYCMRALRVRVFGG